MKLNRTTLRTVDILKMVSKKPDGITLDEICEKLELPKTSAYDIITTLAHTGMVHVVKGQKQRYTIGLTAYRVGINYTNNLDFIGTIDPVLKAFAKEVGKTVFFGVRSDDSIVLYFPWKGHYGKYGAGRAGCLSRPDQFPSPYPAYHSGQDSFHRRTGSGPGKWIRL